MNKKGQALIEFVLILPIFIMLMLAALDGIRIMQEKMKLESLIEDVVLDEKNISEDIKLTKKLNANKITYTLSKDIEIYSPVLTIILDNNFEIKVDRTVYDK